VALRDDVEATETMPEELAHRLAHRRVYLPSTGTQADVGPQAKRHDDVAAQWEIELPLNGVVGLPGRTAERLDPRSMPEELLGQTHLDAFRPTWVDHVVQSRLSGPPDRPLTGLRTIDGRRVEPAYGVYDTEDRVVYRPSGYPWHCAGRVFTWTDASTPGWSWYGSGVLVGSRHVLTAGHVAPWGSPNWSMLFVPGYYDGVSVVETGSSSWVSDFRSLDSGAASVSAHDVSLLRLYDPLGDQLGYFGVKT